MKAKTDKIYHECGITGIISNTRINIPEKLFYPLFSLQHRGQESCGITYLKKKKLVTYKDLGMVSTVLSHYLSEEHPSKIGIGHVRYSTHGGNKLENAQPFMFSCNKGDIAIAHNGNISNSDRLRNELFQNGSIFQTTSDTELIMHLIARSSKPTFFDALLEILGMIEGAYSMVLIHDGSLYAIRDPSGFRPLVMGKNENITVFASETCALDILHAEYIREVKPGEILKMDSRGLKSFSFGAGSRHSHCIFELIYFARPDSTVFGHSVHLVRKKMGEMLAKADSTKADIACPVPDSGNSAALGYSTESCIPLEQGLTRNHYTGRTFIQPLPSQREFAVKMKLHPVRACIEGKSVILVDDSLVRGTTSKAIVKLLKDTGAGEVHFRLTAPEIKHPCYFGIDIPTKEELISNRLNPAEVAEYIGAESVIFLPIESLKKCVKNPDDFCFGCFTGEYSVVPGNADRSRKE
ncbi:MAG: amidophosphoribosyltransferase [Spirochaetales bacterium]|nr:amidophosphoribosyltransferase [Spirochaetales bacterium]